MPEDNPEPVEEKKPAKKAAAKKTASSKPTAAQVRREKAANEQADEQGDRIEERLGEDEKGDTPDEREQWFRAPGLQRMKMSFDGGDLAVLRSVEQVVDDRVFSMFRDAYAVMSDIYDVVREVEEVANPSTGELQPKIENGFVVWKKNPATGSYYEDWSRLTAGQRENFLFEITTKIFDWEQRKERLWTEAMFAKAIFTERFAIEYDAPMTGTIDDRNAVGNKKSAEDRYFALMVTSMSRRADAVVRSMNNLMLRLRDTIA